MQKIAFIPNFREKKISFVCPLIFVLSIYASDTFLFFHGLIKASLEDYCTICDYKCINIKAVLI